MLRKDIPFSWTDKEDRAFKSLVTAFTSAPILRHFEPGTPIVIETDASDFAIAGVLSQPDSVNRLHPIAFYSRKMQDAELNYDIFNKEMLAIIESIRVWRPYLEGARDIIAFTDHRNLESFTVEKELNRRQARWMETLSHYDLKIIYRPGSKMGKPDAMSRRPDYQVGSKAWLFATRPIYCA